MALAADPFAAHLPRPTPGADGPLLIGFAWQWEHGALAMRDFGSTHGPIAQGIAAASARLRSDGDLTRAEPAIGIGFRLVGAALLVAAWWLIPGSVSTLSAIVAVSILVGIPSSWTSGRALLAILVAIAIGHAARTSSRGEAWKRATLAAIGWTALVLYSPDFALYLVPAVVVLLLTDLSIDGSLRGPLAGAAIRVTGLWILLLGVVAVVFEWTSAASGDLLLPFRRLLEIVLTYSEVVGKSWELGPVRAAALGVAALCAIVLGAKTIRAATGSARAPIAVVAVLGALAAASLRGAMVRSDPGHVRLALVPALFLFGWLGSSFARNDRVFWAIGLAGLLVGSPGLPGAELIADRILGSSPGAIETAKRAISGPVELYRLDELRAAAADLPGPISAFPLDNRVGAILGRTLVAPYQQPYLAHTVELQEDYVAGLRAAGSDLLVAFGIDGAGAWALDQGQSITRSPVIFEELALGFEAISDRVLDGGFVLLRRADREKRWTVRPLAPSFESSGGSTVARFDPPARCPLVRVRLRLDHPLSARIGWPAAVELSARSKGRRVGVTRIVRIAGAREFSTELALLGAEEWPQLFRDGGRLEGRVLDELDFVPEDGGAFGVRASKVEVAAIECLEGTVGIL